MYSPVTGRFLSADTIVPESGNPQDLNRYAFVRNNPLKYIDPTGHVSQCVSADGQGYGAGCNAGGLPAKPSRPVVPLPVNDVQHHESHKPKATYESQYADYGRVLVQDPDYYSFSMYSSLPGKLIAGMIVAPGQADPLPIEEIAALAIKQSISGGITLTLDRHKRVFVTFSLSVGRNIVSGDWPATSLVAGTLNTPKAAKPEQIDSLLTGVSFSHGFGAFWGNNVVWSPTSPYRAGETGFSWPVQFNFITVGYGLGPLIIPGFSD